MPELAQIPSLRIVTLHLLILVVSFGTASSHAQTLGGVFGPTVRANDRSLEYRFGLVPDDNAGDQKIAQRIHYQQALNDRIRLRGVLQGSDSRTGKFELSFFQAELLWQTVKQRASGYSSGFRADFRITREDNRANQLGLNWTNQWTFKNGWQARGLILARADIGHDARDGIFLETRTSLTQKLDNGLRVGAVNFSSYGNTSAGLGTFEDQKHRVGPVLSGNLSDDWHWYASTLFSLSDAANSHDFQLRINRTF